MVITNCLVSVILIVSPNDDRVLLWIENEGSPRFVLLDLATPDISARCPEHENLESTTQKMSKADAPRL